MASGKHPALGFKRLLNSLLSLRFSGTLKLPELPA